MSSAKLDKEDLCKVYKRPEKGAVGSLAPTCCITHSETQIAEK